MKILREPDACEMRRALRAAPPEESLMFAAAFRTAAAVRVVEELAKAK